MSRRNFTLLIISLVIAATAFFGFLYFYQPEGTPGEGEGGGNFLSRFNPFGGTQTTPGGTETPGGTPTTTPPPEPGNEVIMLKKVSSMPVAGYGVFKKERFKDVEAMPATEAEVEAEVAVAPPPTEFVSALRYVARVNGNIYQTFADRIEERKFSSTVIPKVYEAYFGNQGESVIMRYLKANDTIIETFVGNLPKEVLGGETSEDNEVRGSFLPENIKDVSLSPDKLKLFYLVNVGKNVVGTTLSLPDNRKVQIFDSPFTEWLSWWPNQRMITVTTKPSAITAGYMYAVDPNIKRLNNILGGVNGLTTLTSPDAKLVLYSGSDLALNIYDIATKSSSSLGIRTLPEKCIWDKLSTVIYCAVPKLIGPGLYPDSWYKGEVSFSDEIWTVDITSGTTNMILDPFAISGVEAMDGIKLMLDEDEKYLFFVNKKDSYLWELELE